MTEAISRMLVLVEGERTDAVLMRRILEMYGFSERYQIIPYCTNIYSLYHLVFEKYADTDPDDLDFLQVLKEQEKDEQKKKIFDDKYSDILLIFDLDPQAPDYSPEKIQKMAAFFTESSDMGKLYLNYPMVESFFHMKVIPDPDYYSYFASIDELKSGLYKRRVNHISFYHDYRKFAATKHECTIVIQQNITKAKQICHAQVDEDIPMQSDILKKQLSFLQREKQVAVLNTCGFFVQEYNSALLI